MDTEQKNPVSSKNCLAQTYVYAKGQGSKVFLGATLRLFPKMWREQMDSSMILVAGSAAPWRGLFMAVSGSPTASQVEVQKPPEAGSAEFEVFAGVK